MTTPYPSDVTDDDKLWSLLAYIFSPLIGIVVLLLEEKKDRPFLRYNAIQSVMLGVVSFLLSFLCVGILLYIYSIVLGIKAYKGEIVEIPVLTKFGKGQGWLQ